MSKIAEKIREIFRIANELERMYPGRHFTPDGHMVGSIGEVIAAEEYGLKLFEASHPVHDARAKDGKLVQIKATQGDRIAISECPEHLVVLKIDRDGGFEEVYNGPGDIAWSLVGKRQKTGQCHVSLAKLRAAMAEIPECGRLPRKG
ncbi:DUF6998 domain-containing protein [Raoultibacter massiliensis]|uniref:DUF6998 domain-containing protein n=1 Tax=Raoultibacter massiliensis TaxID=1852371 RepID=A0ABV1JGQ4_9ACTN